MPKQKKDETAERLGEELVQAMNKLGTSLTETTRAGNLGQMLRFGFSFHCLFVIIIII